ncbi:MAG TPA: shikimate kinase [Microbacteriaceae bacterium]|nr:shikimate kinase [Microbacteriaceae bacterium]
MSTTVVLIGAPGAGKTRTGKRVARALGIPHIDTDKRFVAEHGSIAEFFATYGEPEFRRIEREIVAEAVAEDAIVSLGGGAVLDPGTQELLVGLPVIQLTSSVEAIRERIEREPGEAAKRPLLADGGIEAWTRLAEARRPIYDRLATVTIDTSHRTFESVAEEVVEWLRSR